MHRPALTMATARRHGPRINYINENLYIIIYNILIYNNNIYIMVYYIRDTDRHVIFVTSPYLLFTYIISINNIKSDFRRRYYLNAMVYF